MVAIIFISISEILLTYSYFYVERCNCVASTPTSYSEVLSSNLGAESCYPYRGFTFLFQSLQADARIADYLQFGHDRFRPQPF